MPHDAMLLAGLALPIAAVVLLRINAVMVFLSLCLGEVMVRYVAGNANSMLTWMAPNLSPLSASLTQIGILLLPVVLTSVFMIFSVRGRLRVLLNILPATGVGLLGVLLVVPLLPPGLKFAIQGETLWYQLTKAQALIVGASALVSLFFLWMQRRSLGRRDER